MLPGADRFIRCSPSRAQTDRLPGGRRAIGGHRCQQHDQRFNESHYSHTHLFVYPIFSYYTRRTATGSSSPDTFDSPETQRLSPGLAADSCRGYTGPAYAGGRSGCPGCVAPGMGMRHWVRAMMSSGHSQQGRGRLRLLAKTLYHRIPPGPRRLVEPLARGYRTYDEVRPEFWLAESPPRAGRMPVTLLCAARKQERSFLLEQVLGAGYRERCVGRAWLWNIPRVVARRGNNCCVVLVHARERFRRLLGPQPWVGIPSWVVGEFVLPLSRRILTAKTVREDLRKIRKFAYSFEVTRDIRRFEDFYHHMYLPYAVQTFGDGARTWPPEVLEKSFRQGELLIVNRQGASVAGQLIGYAKPVPQLLVLGVRDASRELVHDGVIGALYHFGLRHLESKGFRRVEVGKARAFLNDGILRYKKKLGLRLLGPAEGCFYLRVLRHTEATKTFLQRNPLIFERDGALYGAVFPAGKDAPLSAEDFRQLDKEFFFEGLSQVLVVPLDSSPAPGPVPPDLAARMALVSTAELFG
jgi:hypothetical protein